MLLITDGKTTYSIKRHFYKISLYSSFLVYYLTRDLWLIPFNKKVLYFIDMLFLSVVQFYRDALRMKNG